MRVGSGHPISVLGKAAWEKRVWCLHVPSDQPGPVCWVGGSPQSPRRSCWLSALPSVGVGVRPAVFYQDASLKGDITRNVFVLVVECWTEEISARPEERAQEDHYCVCEGGCPPEEGRECLEAKPEERKPNRGPRKRQNPGESISEHFWVQQSVTEGGW